MKRFEKVILLLLSIIVTSVLSGCENPLAPFDAEILNQVKDYSVPGIKILSPEQGETYSSMVVVKGILTDLGAAGEGGISSVSYEVINTTISGTAEIADDNSFEFSFSSVVDGIALSGSISIRVTAVDWNGNETTVILNLDNTSGAFSYFEVETGNRSAEIKWTAVPLAESYTIIYTNDGSEPAESNGTPVAVPSSVAADAEGVFTYTIDGLENGDLYRFRLLANCSDGQKNFSSSGSVIPLSPYALCPSVQSSYDRIILSWRETAGFNSYRVYRASNEGGPYQDISGIITGVNYTDKNLVTGSRYFYKIAPAIEGSVMSAPAFASPGGTEDTPIRVISTASGLGETTSFIIEDDFAYCIDTVGGLVTYDISSSGSISHAANHVITDAGSGEAYQYSGACSIAAYKSYLYISCVSPGGNVNSPDNIAVYKINVQGIPVFNNIQKLDIANTRIYDFVPYTDSSSKDLLLVGFRDTSSKLSAVDISTPDNLSLVALTSYDADSGSFLISGMSIYKDILYLKSYGGSSNYHLYSYDIETFFGESAGEHKYSDKYAVASSYRASGGNIYFTGDSGKDIACVTTINDGIKFIDITIPGSWSELYCSYAMNQDEYICGGDGMIYITYPYDNLVRCCGVNFFGDSAANNFDFQDLYTIPLGFSPSDIRSHEGNLYVSGEDGLSVIGLHGGYSGHEYETSVNYLTSYGNPSVTSLCFHGDTAYCAIGYYGIEILNNFKPENLTHTEYVNRIKTAGGGVSDLAVQGDYLYAAVRSSSSEFGYGIDIFNILENGGLEINNSLLTKGFLGIEVRGSYLFAVKPNQLYIINVEDPQQPEVVVTKTIEGAYNIKLDGDYAYIASNALEDGGGNTCWGVVRVDVSSVDAPRVVGSCITGPLADNSKISMALYDYNIFISGSDRLYVVDISESGTLSDANLVEDGDSETGDGFRLWEDETAVVYGLTTDGRFLYLSAKIDSEYKIVIIDYKAKDYPVIIDEFVTNPSVYGSCALNSGALYVAGLNKTISVYNIGE